MHVKDMLVLIIFNQSANKISIIGALQVICSNLIGLIVSELATTLINDKVHISKALDKVGPRPPYAYIGFMGKCSHLFPTVMNLPQVINYL